MEVQRFHSADGFMTVLLVTVGPKFVSIIPMDSSGIRIVKVPASDQRYMKPMDYPIEKALRHFRHAARNFGCTQAAALLIGYKRKRAIPRPSRNNGGTDNDT